MAERRAIGRFEAALGVVGLLALATTYALITGWNPVPTVLNWVESANSLSEPEVTWKARLGARPEYVVATSQAVLAVGRDGVEARDVRTGAKIWSRDAPWASVAGADPAAVVVAGQADGKGFDVLDPPTGAVRWTDDNAIGAWTYREAVLTLTCESLTKCAISYREPARGEVRWRTDLPGGGKVLAGVNHALPGSRDLSASTVDSRVGIPAELPAMLGFPVNNKVQVLETEDGHRLPEAETSGTTRVVIVSGRALYSTAERRSGQCRYALDARDPVTGERVWHKEGYDLRTASGAGCEQRRDPVGGGGTLAAVRGDNREVLLDAAGGRELWVGEPGERPLATDGRLAVIRAASGDRVRMIDLGDHSTLWQHPVGKDAEATMTRFATIVVDEDRIIAMEPGTGRVLIDVQSSSKVVGAGPEGVVLASGRTVGLLPFGSIKS